MGAATLELDGLVAHRGGPLFDPVTVSLAPGTLLAVVGPNGAGKSSLLSALAGTGVRSTGEVRWDGEPLHRLPPRRRAQVLALMTQDSMAANELLVRDVVAIGTQAGHRHREGAAYTLATLARLGIEGLAHRRYARLSGGERQLVQVARVLAQASPIMLLDEPSSALDLAHQLTLMHRLREAASDGHVIVATMHDLNQALRWATDVLVIADGRARLGHPTEVLTPEVIRSAYGVTAEVFHSPSGTPSLSLVRTSCPTANGLSTPADPVPRTVRTT